MPISKSAKKALRTAQNKTSLNRYRKAVVKDALKNVDGQSLPKAVSLVDKAAKWGIIHKNKAARLKSQLMSSIKLEDTAKTAAAKPKAAAKKVAKKATTKAKK